MIPEPLLAHHPIVTAIPFVVPGLTFSGAVLFLSLRERRRRAEEGPEAGIGED